MGKIFLKDMEFFAYHGHYDEEKFAGNKFVVDLYLWTDTETVQKSDNIEDALNYQVAYAIVSKVVQETQSNLLENLADEIINAIIKEFPILTKVKVKVCKTNPPMGGQIGSVGVEIQRKC